MKRQELKHHVLAVLGSSTPDEASAKLKIHDYSVVGPLFGALCNPDERIRWNSVVCFGSVVPAIAADDMERARIVMRRFLWTLNDESGGIGWGAPEAMGEILSRSTVLRREYLHMLVSYMREDGEELHQDGNYLELPMLQRGLLWGIGRICQTCPEDIAACDAVEDIAAYLAAEDAHVVALAMYCLGFLVAGSLKEKVVLFTADSRRVRLFIDRQIQSFSVAEIASSTLERMVAVEKQRQRVTDR